MSESEKRTFHFETMQLHAGQEEPDPASGARAVPIYATTSYVFEDCAHAAARFALEEPGNIYGRLTNSTQAVFEERIAALEGGAAALAVASGAAAITYTLLAIAAKGEHIVAQKTIYGGTSSLLAHTLPLYGIEASFVDVHCLQEVEAAIRENTKRGIKPYFQNLSRCFLYSARCPAGTLILADPSVSVKIRQVPDACRSLASPLSPSASSPPKEHAGPIVRPLRRKAVAQPVKIPDLLRIPDPECAVAIFPSAGKMDLRAGELFGIHLPFRKLIFIQSASCLKRGRRAPGGKKDKCENAPFH